MVQTLATVEAGARDIREFQPSYLLKLLRTPAYLRAVYPAESEEEIRRRVGRNETILRDDRRRMTLLLSEGALRWRVASQDVMREQLRHLVEVAELNHLRLGILPWRHQVCAVVGHAFHLYDRRLVYVGYATGGLMIDQPEEVAVYDDLFDRLCSCALFEKEAVAEIEQIALML
jgi:hypothetical protein